MIASRFRSIVEDFVIGFFSNHHISLLDAVFPQFAFCIEPLLFLVRFQTSQFLSFRKWVQILFFLDATFTRRSGSESWEISAAAGVSTILRFTAKSSSHSGIIVLQFPATSSLQFLVTRPWLLCVFAESKEVDRSCGGDVEDEVVVEFDESLELPMVRSSQFCRRFASRFGLDAARDDWVARKCNRALCKACQGTIRQKCPRATAQWRKYENHAHTLSLPHSTGPPHWLSPLLWGVLDLLRVVNSPELKSFLLCMEAPESITNCRSSGLVEQGAGITQTSARK